MAFGISQELFYLKAKFLKNGYIKHKEGNLYHLLLYKVLLTYTIGGLFVCRCLTVESNYTDYRGISQGLFD